MLCCAEENHRVTAFTPANVIVPENLHEIAGLGLLEAGKVVSKSELVKQSRRAGTVRVPASPHAFAVVLIANDQLIQGRVIELQFTAVAQLLDRLDENEIRRARAETHVRFGRNDEKFSRFEMGRGLQLYFCDVRGRIFAAARHSVDLIEDERIETGCVHDVSREGNREDESQSAHWSRK